MYLDADDLARRLACFRDHRFVEIDGAGHMVHFDRPRELLGRAARIPHRRLTAQARPLPAPSGRATRAACPCPGPCRAQSLRLYLRGVLLILLTAAASAQLREHLTRARHRRSSGGAGRSGTGRSSPCARASARRTPPSAWSAPPSASRTSPTRSSPRRRRHSGARRRARRVDDVRRVAAVFYILEEDVDPEITETLAEFGEDRTEAGRGAGRARRPTQPPAAVARPGPLGRGHPCCSCWQSGRSCGSSAGRSRVSPRRRTPRRRRGAAGQRLRRADHPPSGPGWRLGDRSLPRSISGLATRPVAVPHTRTVGRRAWCRCAQPGLEGAGGHRRFDSQSGHRRHHPPASRA